MMLNDNGVVRKIALYLHRCIFLDFLGTETKIVELNNIFTYVCNLCYTRCTNTYKSNSYLWIARSKCTTPVVSVDIINFSNGCKHFNSQYLIVIIGILVKALKFLFSTQKRGYYEIISVVFY